MNPNDKHLSKGGYYGDDDIPEDAELDDTFADDGDPRNEYNPDDKEDDNENNREW